MSSQRLRQLIRTHEGERQYPYKDTVGKLTIGVGRNLDDTGLRQSEIDLLLDNDVRAVTEELTEHGWFCGLNPVRQAVVVDMAFNLGVAGLMQFDRMLAAVVNGDYQTAADEMRDSRWHEQVKTRAARLERMMRTGEWPGDLVE